MPNLTDSQGNPTVYGFACGYIQRDDNGSRTVTLWKEHSTYHVRVHSSEIGRISWNSFRTVTEARNAYRKARREKA